MGWSNDLPDHKHINSRAGLPGSPARAQDSGGHCQHLGVRSGPCPARICSLGSAPWQSPCSRLCHRLAHLWVISLLTLQASGIGRREPLRLPPVGTGRSRVPSPARVARQRVNSAAGSRLRGAGAGTATGALAQLPGGRRSGPRVRAGGGGRPRLWRRVESEGEARPTQDNNLR